MIYTNPSSAGRIGKGFAVCGEFAINDHRGDDSANPGHSLSVNNARTVQVSR